jgi:hypothetical protein
MVAYNSQVPTASHWPGNDQQPMQTNFASIQSLIDIDHVDFEQDQYGQHKQINYSALQPSPSIAAGAVGLSFVKNDTASNANNFFQNATATYLMSCVKAFGVFTCTSGNADVTSPNFFNINATITKPGPGQITYAITLNSNVVSGNDVIILVTASTRNASPGYSFSNPTLMITGDITSKISFIILQGNNA